MNELEAALQSIVDGSALTGRKESANCCGDPFARIWYLQETVDIFEQVARSALAAYRGEGE